jgi:hypothetical protein
MLAGGRPPPAPHDGSVPARRLHDSSRHIGAPPRDWTKRLVFCLVVGYEEVLDMPEQALAQVTKEDAA